MGQLLQNKDLKGLGILTKLGQALMAKDDQWVCDSLTAVGYSHTTASMTLRRGPGISATVTICVKDDKSFEITVSGVAQSKVTRFASVLGAVENILWRRDAVHRLWQLQRMVKNLEDRPVDHEDLDSLIMAFQRYEHKREREEAAAKAQPQVQGGQGD